MGRWFGDWRIELCLLQTLRYGLPMQRADGKIHARACGISHGPAKNDVGRHDRCSEGRRAGDGLWSDSEALGSRIAHAGVAHPPYEDSLHVLRRGMQL